MRQKRLNICNVNILNERVSTICFTFSLLDIVVVVQNNKTKYLIN